MDDYRKRTDPIVVARAEGVRIFDVDGRSYIDANASWWTSTLGHNHPRVVEALKRQADRMCHAALAGITHAPAAELAARLAQAAPDGLDHVFFSDNGSTAVEVAMKQTLQYWQQNERPDRRAFVSLEGAFHGETLGCTALGGIDAFRKPFEGCLVKTYHAPSPGNPADAGTAAAALEELVAAHADEIAAVVLEPMVQGASGMRIYDADYLREARRICDEHDTFLVFDEVFTGYGRTGTMWAADHAGISPDVLCMAKGFVGGTLPMGATISSARIFEGFLGESDRAFYYGHTFCGNPLGAAVALEVLRVFEEERVLEGAKGKAEKIERTFRELSRLPHVAGVRTLGMIGALDLAGDAGYLADGGWRVYEEAKKRGAYLRPLGNVVYVTPSVNVPDAELEELLDILGESVRAVG
ncbi:MAG: adenosylmethionine--8-amino-7-oxononanoate transaminase [Deltaproteobacteria bacterium]|nr:adenosylmethionine--8-amino-7-oxononanoate transaminase [Deltaproteobacteria bacterium]MBW2447173.1 adenosylmethionine--8-amino-7-oxononanoate transaminase [Deltaproteobacteria bacterium]